MTKHSILTNADDLHYAKVRTFTGSPTQITPDFVDQVLAAADTNKVYRAISNTQGGLIELAPISGGGAGAGASVLALVGSGKPQTVPSAIGEIYFDTLSNTFWIAVDVLGAPTWRSSTPPIKIRSLNLSDSALIYAFPQVYGDFAVFYSPSYDYLNQAIELNTFTQIGLATEIEMLFDQYGVGIYGVGYNLIDPNNEVTNYSLGISPYFYPNNSPTDSHPNGLLWVEQGTTHNGKYINGFFVVSALRRLGCDIDIQVALFNVS